jgi:phosphoribosyl 1,2-cyclic phosphodiesterase
MKPKAHITFWGVRGSLPSPGPKTVKYGGNTPCVEISYGDTIIICDAGTGIRPLGADLILRMKHKKIAATILLSHLHLDHLIGLPFFEPLYKRGNCFNIMNPGGSSKELKATIRRLLSPPYFPIDISKVPAGVKYNPPSPRKGAWPQRGFTPLFTNGGENYTPPFEKGGQGGIWRSKIGEVIVESFRCNHPGDSYAFKFRLPNGKVIVYTSDNEPSKKIFASFVRWISGADILIHDAQYTPHQYKQKIGWGHSPYLYPVSLAVRGQIKRLFLFHYDPATDDKTLEKIHKRMKYLVRCMGFKLRIDLAREGLKIVI